MDGFNESYYMHMLPHQFVSNEYWTSLMHICLPWINIPISSLWWNFVSQCSCHGIILKFSGVITIDKRDIHAKGKGQRSRSQRSRPNVAISGLWLQFEFTYGDEMMHKAWCYLGEVTYCFSRSSVKFQGHRATKIIDFDPNWAFADCNSGLNSVLAIKWCTKLGPT